MTRPAAAGVRQPGRRRRMRGPARRRAARMRPAERARHAGGDPARRAVGHGGRLGHDGSGRRRRTPGRRFGTATPEAVRGGGVARVGRGRRRPRQPRPGGAGHADGAGGARDRSGDPSAAGDRFRERAPWGTGPQPPARRQCTTRGLTAHRDRTAGQTAAVRRQQPGRADGAPWEPGPRDRGTAAPVGDRPAAAGPPANGPQAPLPRDGSKAPRDNRRTPGRRRRAAAVPATRTGARAQQLGRPRRARAYAGRESPAGSGRVRATAGGHRRARAAHRVRSRGRSPCAVGQAGAALAPRGQARPAEPLARRGQALRRGRGVLMRRLALPGAVLLALAAVFLIARVDPAGPARPPSGRPGAAVTSVTRSCPPLAPGAPPRGGSR